MAEAWADIVGSAEARALLERIPAGLEDLRTLHEWYVIAAQARALDEWPTSPALSSLTRGARRRGGSKVLFDEGQLFRTVTGGSNPGQISNEPGSLNEATPRWGRLGSNLLKARLLREGGTVTPKSKKYLAVPLTPKASKAGGPRSFGSELALWPFKSGDGFFLVEGEKHTVTRGSNKGKTVVRARQIGEGRPIAHYMLTKKVTIPGRDFLPSVSSLLPDLIDATDRYIAYIATGRGR